MLNDTPFVFSKGGFIVLRLFIILAVVSGNLDKPNRSTDKDVHVSHNGWHTM